MNLNKAMIIGNLTRDPEGRTTPDGTPVCSFGIATSTVWKDQQGNRQERTEFHNIVAWRKLAEICTQYLRKGSKVYLEGRLQTRTWDDQSGVKRSRTEIVAENMIMLDRPGTGGQRSNQNYGASPSHDVPEETTQNPEPSSTPSPSGSQKTEEINIEEIPF